MSAADLICKNKKMRGLKSMSPAHVYGKVFYGYTMMAVGTEPAFHGGLVEIRSLSLLMS